MGGKKPAGIDVVQLEKLAQLHCTIEEAAAFFGCASRTLHRYLDAGRRDPKYREAWERGRQMGKLSLRRLQWQHANGVGSSAVQMTIHMSKHWMGESEKSLLEITGRDGEPIQHQDVTEAADRFTRKIRDLVARVGERDDPGDNQR